MKRTTITACLAGLLLACNSNDEKPVQTSQPTVVAAATDSTNAAPMDSATMMKNWQEYMTPGKEHQLMASWNGNWNGEVTLWMAPGAPPTTSKMSAVNKMILGGRYQQSNYKGSFDGMPFEGQSLLGFDNAKRTFTSTWIDNMGTGIMIGEGPWDEASQSVTVKGTMMDPMTKKETTFREVMRTIDANTQIMEMYAPGPDGKEYKSMEIKLTRKK